MTAQHPQPQRKLRTWALIASGSLASVGAVMFSNMPETIKTRMQLDGELAARSGYRIEKQYTNIIDACIKIVRFEGFRTLHAGLGSAIGIQIVYNGIRLGLFEPIQQIIRATTECGPENFFNKIISGALSGGVGVAISSPLYLSKTRLQAQSVYFHAAEQHHYKNTFDCLNKIMRQNGFFGLFHGVRGILPRVMIGSGIQLSCYDKIKQLSIEKFGLYDGVPAHIIASMLSSLIAVTITNPFDVVSTRLYQSSGRETQYNGVIDCFKKTIQTEGWSALQKGWLAFYLRMGPHVILTFVFLEKIRAWFRTFDSFTKDTHLLPITTGILSDSD